MATYRGHYILIVITVLFPVTCFTSYTIAVLEGDVRAWFPYISDTGTQPPESCVFGFLLGIYALVSAHAIRLRYRQVAEFYEDSGRNRLLITNKVALVVGLIASLGVYLVANFQETSVLVVHLIGAFLAFFVGGVYLWLQTVISYRTRLLPGHSLNLTRLRLLLSILHGLLSVIFLVFATMASKVKPVNDRTWGPGSKGFSEHVTSTFLEWVVAFIMTAYFLSFVKEFHKFEIRQHKLNFLESGNVVELNSAQNATPEVVSDAMVVNGGVGY